jgi:hypothetical protein
VRSAASKDWSSSTSRIVGTINPEMCVMRNKESNSGCAFTSMHAGARIPRYFNRTETYSSNFCAARHARPLSPAYRFGASPADRVGQRSARAAAGRRKENLMHGYEGFWACPYSGSR